VEEVGGRREHVKLADAHLHRVAVTVHVAVLGGRIKLVPIGSIMIKARRGKYSRTAQHEAYNHTRNKFFHRYPNPAAAPPHKPHTTMRFTIKLNHGIEYSTVRMPSSERPARAILDRQSIPRHRDDHLRRGSELHRCTQAGAFRSACAASL